ATRYLARADFVHARQVLAPRVREDGATATVMIFGAIVALSDPLTGSQVASDEARRILGQAAERDPRVWYPRLQLANLEPDELVRIGMLRTAIEQWPHVLTIPLTLVDVLEARGWESQSDEVVAQARQSVPDA